MTIPHSYEIPAAIMLVLGGAVACFAGYRLFRVVLGLYGFIFGALFATAALNPAGSLPRIGIALAGGLAGMLALAVAYFVGMAIAGAAVGAMLAHVGWSAWRAGEPPVWAVIGLALTGAVGAMLLQRSMAVISTAFGGGWTMIVGGLAMAGGRNLAPAVSATEAWALYPLIPPPARPWVPAAWVALGLAGTAVQFGFTGRTKAAARGRKKKAHRKKAPD